MTKISTKIEILIIVLLVFIAIISSMNKTHAATTYTANEQLVIDLTYPVGSILENDDSSFNPNIEYSWQTWEKIEGKMLMSSGTVGSTTYTVGQTGGSNDAVVGSHNHTFTGNLLSNPSYNWSHTHTVSIGGGAKLKSPTGSAFYKSGTSTSVTSSSSGGHTHTYTARGTITRAGKNPTDKNLPPYYATNIWKRVS